MFSQNFCARLFHKLPLHWVTFVSHGTQGLRGMWDLQVLITELLLNYETLNTLCVFLATPWEQSPNKAVRTQGRDTFPGVY